MSDHETVMECYVEPTPSPRVSELNSYHQTLISPQYVMCFQFTPVHIQNISKIKHKSVGYTNNVCVFVSQYYISSNWAKNGHHAHTHKHTNKQSFSSWINGTRDAGSLTQPTVDGLGHPEPLSNTITTIPLVPPSTSACWVITIMKHYSAG